MFNSNVIRWGLAAVALGASSAYAADTASMQVTASVNAVCKLSLSGDMAFGALDVTVATDATKAVTATYQCTKGTPVTSFTVGSVTAATGANGTYSGAMTSGTTSDTIPYTVTWADPGTFAGLGMQPIAANQKSVTLDGKILNSDYVNKTPASYSQTVGIAVNY